MQNFLKSIYILLTAISVLISSSFNPAVIQPETDEGIASCLEYPEEVVVSLESAGLSAQEMIDRASAELPEYVQSGGYDDIAGVFLSPYYTSYLPAKIDGNESDTNTVDVRLENITAAGFDVTKAGIFLEAGKNSSIIFE